ncbi:MAG: diguanylate cyclase [Sulfurospirillaceae bacterium]|nr:diguanylate cyclase [Sulfurospirillaceae bacterium]MDD2827352.1 diguanylate cyclase [Sulfurospirillaceae bacterium]
MHQWFYLLLLIFYPLYSFSVELSVDEQNYLKHLGTVKVCVDPDWEPFESLDSAGKYTGIGADLLFLVVSRIGLPIEILQTKDWDESVEASKMGKCQLISFLNQTPKRDTWLLFTQPHFTDPNVFITREEHPFIANLAELLNETIVFPKGTAMEERIRKDYPNLKVITTETEMETFNLVSQKKVDIAMRSLIVAAYTIKKEGLFNLKIAGQLPNYTNQLRMGVIKTEPLLKQILNKGINSITSEDRALIVNKYITIQAQTVQDNVLLLKVLIVFLVISLLALYHYLELKKYTKKLVYLSETDMLTQLNNRMKIEQELLIQVARAKRNDNPLSILLMDIDNFKKINDIFGHPIGDKILIEMSRIAKGCLRNYDYIGRWGGEEFLVICPACTQDEALSVATRINQEIKQAHYHTKKSHTISIGIASMSSDDSPYTLVSKADKALYQAKEEGRDKMCMAL